MRSAIEVTPARFEAGNENVESPMTNFPPGSRSIEVPLISSPGPPAVRVLPSIEKAVGLGVNVWPAMV